METEADSLTVVRQAACNHAKEKHYTRKQLDVLNALDVTLTRCLGCHKILAMDVKSINSV